MVCFFEFLVNSLVLFLDIIELAVEGFFLLLNSALLALNLFASVGNFLFALVSEAVNLVLTLKNNLTAPTNNAATMQIIAMGNCILTDTSLV